jgi:hypothetical protein
MPALVFDSLKAGKTGNARLIGNAGSSDILYFRTAAGITLIETTGMGGVNTTTVFNAQPQGGRFKAVHSRHLEGITGLMLSQYYGLCRSF